jgi:hypothetical protein
MLSYSELERKIPAVTQQGTFSVDREQVINFLKVRYEEIREQGIEKITLEPVTTPLSVQEIYELINLIKPHKRLHEKMCCIIPVPRKFFELVKLLDSLSLQSPENYFSLIQLSKENIEDLYTICIRIKSRNGLGALQALLKNNVLNNDYFYLMTCGIDLSDSSLLDLENSISLCEEDISPVLLTKVKAKEIAKGTITLISFLHKNAVLNEDIMEFIFDEKIKNSHVLVYNMLCILKGNDLLSKDNFNSINFIYDGLTKNVSHILKSYMIEEVKMVPDITNLDLINMVRVLDKSQVNITEDKYKAIFDQSNTKLAKLINVLTLANLHIKDHLNLLFSMNIKEINASFSIISNLYDYKLLNTTSYKTILNMIAPEIKEAKVADIFKISRKEVDKALDKKSEIKRSELIINNDLHLFIEHQTNKNYLKGSHGIIKKLFNSADEAQPTYALKKFLANDIVSEEAKRETIYQQLLGHDSFYFKRNDKWYCLMTWKKGDSLASYKKEKIGEFKMETRLRWLISGLTDLNALHADYILHGDIKELNFILDTTAEVMRLTDFDTTGPLFKATDGGTTKYLPPDFTIRKSFSSDIYAMSLVAANIFPELYTLNLVENVSLYKDRLIATKNMNENPTFLEKGIIRLIDSMNDLNEEKRCTAKDALKYCQLLLEKNHELDDEVINQIAMQTIDHIELTEEDVLHQSTRPRFLK